MRLIFQTTEHLDGTPINPPHRRVLRRRSVRIVPRLFGSGTGWDERTGTAIVDDRNRTVATQLDPASGWAVGNLIYDEVILEDS